MHSKPNSANIRFYEELNDFLPITKRKQNIHFYFSLNPTIKDIIESFGIPHAEVDLIIVNNQSVNFDYRLQHNDRVAVYPVFESLNISPIIHCRPKPLRQTKFILDVHLGKLARYLRLLGFDCYYERQLADETIIDIAAKKKRIILTRDIGILKNKKVTHGYYIRNTDPHLQIREIIKRLDLMSNLKPFTRCLECNSRLNKIQMKQIQHLLPKNTQRYFTHFQYCKRCDKVYWKGSHYEKMQAFINKLQEKQKQKWQFWIDRGGTFTDVIALDPDNQLHTQKVLSDNPQHYQDASLHGIRKILKLTDHDPIPSHDIECVKMGTTVATNALLQHQGEPTVLAITAGFRDALQIAYQNRPDLFALEVKLPQPLYEKVIEIKERVDVHGNILTPLDCEDARQKLKQMYAQGFRSLAIVLMHSYQFNQHEITVADCAKTIGFKHVCLSHQASPLSKLVSRGDTAVMDATLSPILSRYIDSLATALKHTPLFFMQSNGGLARSEFFHGKDSILSGPAAGVIGAIKTAQAAGFDNIISFDMGGTSTDVAHFNGELERIDETMVAGFRLRAPMLHIHTIAAGGGSIVEYRQGRYQVGPQSAGANPGPACYRQGGPLTITDCNLMLGRIQTAYFPKVFGTKQNQALDSKTVEKKFASLAKKITEDRGDQRSPQEVAYGFWQVAINNMANAIKKISIQRGHDITDYTLCCFGGAAGQHACAVADELGMSRIMIHPLAGVLSAYGMGLADCRLLKEKTIEKPFQPSIVSRLAREFKKLCARGEMEMQKQGISREKISSKRFARLRYHGTDTPLEISFSDFNTMQQDFTHAYQQAFGYHMPEKSITVESIAAEIIGNTATAAILSTKTQNLNPAKPTSYVDIFIENKNQSVALYERSLLNPQTIIKGPAMITEPNSTTIVDPGWEASINTEQQLILNRTVKRQQKFALGTAVDPVMLEIFNNLYMSIAEQMGTALAKTAYSTNIKERLDFSCAIFDAQGDLVANAQHIPVHLGSMRESIQVIISERKNSMQPGDVFMLNNPYNGGTHLPDVTVITPVFLADQNEPLFYVASRAHQADIGGITPGSVPASSKNIHEEGVLIDNFQCVKTGRFLQTKIITLLTDAPYPVRNVKQNLADLKAQIAANQKGVMELKRMCNQFGLATVKAYMQHVQDNATACVQAVIDSLSDGQFQYEMDNGCRIAVNIHVDKNKKQAVIDFTGTSPQQPHNFNAPKAVCYAAVIYVFRSLVHTPIPLNQGCLKPLKIIIPDDCLLNPKYPAAVVAGNVETSQCIVDTLFGALNIMAASQGTMNNLSFGNDQYQYYETICGGCGAGDGFDGASAVHSHMTNSLLTDPEILEQRYPLLVKTFAIRRGSGGKGRWRGGDGVIRCLQFLEPMRAAIVSNRRIIPPYGMAGGEPGKPGENRLIKADGNQIALTSTTEIELNADDCLLIKTPGGGGYGRPNTT